jgi:hypothetical protein
MRTFTSSVVLFILAASAASLTDGRLTRQRHGRRGRHDHNDIAQRMAGDVVLRSFLNSRFTWFETGLLVLVFHPSLIIVHCADPPLFTSGSGACGKTNVGSDLVRYFPLIIVLLFFYSMLYFVLFFLAMN